MGSDKLILAVTYGFTIPRSKRAHTSGGRTRERPDSSIRRGNGSTDRKSSCSKRVKLNEESFGDTTPIIGRKDHIKSRRPELIASFGRSENGSLESGGMVFNEVVEHIDVSRNGKSMLIDPRRGVCRDGMRIGCVVRRRWRIVGLFESLEMRHDGVKSSSSFEVRSMMTGFWSGSKQLGRPLKTSLVVPMVSIVLVMISRRSTVRLTLSLSSAKHLQWNMRHSRDCPFVTNDVLNLGGVDAG